MTQVSSNKRSVLDERFLKCGVCSERFWDNSKLREHMETHDKNKPLLCTICNKTFVRIQDLDKHYLLHRQLMQPYGCPACESRFVTQQQLIVHVDNIHPELTIGNKDANDNLNSIPSTSTKKATLKSSPKLNKNQIKIISVQSIPKTADIREKEGPSKVTPPTIELQLPLPSTKKSILKTAPTPSGKKRPLVWKDPIVSPEKKLRGDLTLKVVGDKKGLVILPQDSTTPKRFKIVTSEAAGNPTVQAPVRCSIVPADANKNMTPVRKTPITKTKLMQSIADLCDKQTPNEKKSIVETRKNLLNGLQITSVPGPIRVSKVAKQPFIVYSPCKENNTVQAASSSGESKKGVQVYTPKSRIMFQGNVGVSGNSGDGKVVQAVSAGNVTTNFDAVKLLPSTTKLSPCITINVGDKNKVQKQISAFDNLTKNVVPMSKLPPTIQLIPVQTSPISIVQSPTDVKNTGGRKVVKIDKLPKVVAVAKKGIVKSPCTISAVSQLSPRIANVPQASIIKSSIQSSPKIKTVDGEKSEKATRQRLTRSQKVATSLKHSTTESEKVTQIISEKEVLRDPGLQHQQLKILLPSIRLKRLSDAEIRMSTANVEGKLQVLGKTCINEEVSTKTREELVNLKSAEASGVKRSKRKQAKAATKSSEEQIELKKGRRAQRRGKLQSPELNNTKEEPKLRTAEAVEDKTHRKLQSSESSSAEKKSNSKSDIKTQKAIVSSTSSSDQTISDISDTASTVEESLQTVSAPSSASKTNTTRSRSNQLKKVPGNKKIVEITEANQTTEASVSEVCDSNVISGNKSKRPKQQASSPNIINQSVKSVPAIRRSQRSLALSVKKAALFDLKKVQSDAKKAKVLKKEVIKKQILKKAIEKEMEAMEGDGSRNNVFENSAINRLINSPLLSQGLPKTPTPNKIRVVTLTPEMMRKLKETVLKNSSTTTPNHVRVVVPSELVSKIQNTAVKNQISEPPKASVVTTESSRSPNVLAKTAGSPANFASTSKAVSGSPPIEVIKYTLEDVKRIQLKRKQDIAKNAEKEKIYLKMLEKFNEKEKKKQVKFCEKKLSRFIIRHRASHLDDLKERLLDVRNLSPESGVQLLKDVMGLDCSECKQVIGSTLSSLGFGNEEEVLGHDKALQGFIALSTSKIRKKRPVKPSGVGGRKKRPVGRPRKVNSPQSNPVKLAEVSPGKEPSPRKLVKIQSKNEPSLETSFSNNIESSPKNELLSHLNSGVKSYQAPKQTDSPIKTDPVKMIRRNIRKKAKDLSPVSGDPFTDTSIITEEKFVLKCSWCQNPNCDGLHPENFLI